MSGHAYNNVASSLTVCASGYLFSVCFSAAQAPPCLFYLAVGCTTIALELPRVCAAIGCCPTEREDLDDAEFPSTSMRGSWGVQLLRPRPQVRAVLYGILLAAAPVLALVASSLQTRIYMAVMAILLVERTVFYTVKLWKEKRLYKGLDHPDAVYDHLDTFSVELTPIEVEQLQPTSPDDYFPTKLNLSLDDVDGVTKNGEMGVTKLTYESKLKDSADDL